MFPPVRYVCEFDTSGYAVAARRTIHALESVGVPVAWEPLVDRPEGRVPAPDGTPVPPEVAQRRRRRTDGETVVLHSVPRGWAATVAGLQPNRVIGHTVWEADRVPTIWRTEMAAADAFWVPTRWNQDAFQSAFDRPVHVVPHTVSTTESQPPPIEVGEETFVVASVAAWDWRKRPDLAIEAFARAFGPTDDVALVVKTTPWPIAWPTHPRVATVAHIAEVLRPFPDHARVIIDTGPWSEAQVQGLLARADCFLSLTSAEGWGLGAFDAACAGTPVLITGYGGQVEWLGAEYPGLLPFAIEPARHPDAALFEPGMTWATTDVGAAVGRLRDLSEGGAADLRTAAVDLAPVLRARYAPDVVGTVAASLLEP